jgi:hypothetical protein
MVSAPASLMSANSRLDCLLDLIRLNANVHVECRCGHISILSAERFNRYCLLRGWNTQLATLHYRLKCAACGQRPNWVKATNKPPGEDRFPTTEGAWRQLYRRMRD